MACSSNSFVRNHDGEGFYTSSNNKVIKNLNKIDYYSFKDAINTSNVFISLQRLSSSGFSLEYNQPFHNNELTIIHNGVINEFLGNKGSDTWGFWLEFNKVFQSKTGNRERRIVKTIKELMKKVYNGWYSILIYDKVSRKTYYFKNESPSIHFYRYKGMLFITTNADNKLFLRMFGTNNFNNYDIKEVDIRSNKIYKIVCEKEQIRIYDLGKVIESENYIDRCFDCGNEIEGTTYQENGDKYCSECWEVHSNEEVKEPEEEYV